MNGFGATRRWTIGLIVAAGWFSATTLFAQEPVGPIFGALPPLIAQGPGAKEDPAPKKKVDLFDLDIERLGNLPVRTPASSAFSTPLSSLTREPDFLTSTAPRSSATVGQSPAAVYVITAEDIRRTGIRNIPDLFRMVPGMQVASINANQWAVSSRGLNQQFNNKLLVLMDGRSIYTPLFAGVRWGERDMMLDDIERIEVIRGPGATLWGSNAVNGVINIISKHARDTQGTMVYGGGGSSELGFTGFRHGGRLGENAWFRLSGMFFDRDGGLEANGTRGSDAWDSGRFALRVDWQPSLEDTVIVQGDIYTGNLGDRYQIFDPNLQPPFSSFDPVRSSIGGGYFQTRWNRKISETANISTQFAYDHTEISNQLIAEIRDTFDFEFQHRFRIGQRHDMIYGLGYRFTTDAIRNSFSLGIDPPRRSLNLASGFIQDDVTVVPDRLHWIVGTKLEHNDLSGFQVQPGTRLLWTPSDRLTLWSAVSRAVRNPSRREDDLNAVVGILPPDGLFPGAPATESRFLGSRGFQSEVLMAYEAGYRVAVNENISLDVAGFFNSYERLATNERGTPFFQPLPTPSRLILPFYADNEMRGETYGVEVATRWQPTKWWQWNFGYTFLRAHLKTLGNNDGQEGLDGTSPNHQVHIRSYLNLPGNWNLDTAMYYVDSLETGRIPAYVRMDVRLGWQPRKNVECILGLQNLLDPSHFEFGRFNDISSPTQVERSIYGMIRLSF